MKTNNKTNNGVERVVKMFAEREQARRRKRQWGLLRPQPQIDN